MLLLMYMAKYEYRDTLSRKFLNQLIELEPEYADQLKKIGKHLNFIKRLRDLYRLKVAAQNVIELNSLPSVAASMGYGDDMQAAKKLYNDFLRKCENTGEIIKVLVGTIKP